MPFGRYSRSSEPSAERLKKQFTAKLRESRDNPGAWTYVKMAGSVAFNAKLRAAIGKEAGDTVR
jgi:hypothetical protein